VPTLEEIAGRDQIDHAILRLTLLYRTGEAEAHPRTPKSSPQKGRRSQNLGLDNGGCSTSA